MSHHPTRPTSEELKSLLEESTPGDWQFHQMRVHWNLCTDDVSLAEVFRVSESDGRANASLMALSRQLATEILEVREENEGLKKALVTLTANAPWIQCGDGRLQCPYCLYYHPKHREDCPIIKARSALSAVSPGEVMDET
jgi:hypothetical protein